MSSDLIVYGDYHSQPSRAVFAFCKLAGIPHKVQEVAVMQGEHFSAEFKKINPRSQVPAISDNGFVLAESHAIMKYICATRKVDDHWYPADPRERARVEEYLNWHHTNIRLGAGSYFFRKYVMPVIHRNSTYAQSTAQECWDILVKSSKFIEENYLAQDSKFLFGDRPTIADLSLGCELATMRALEFDYREIGCPKVEAYLTRFLAIPEIKEISETALENLKVWRKTIDSKRAKL